jgi:hypothetical protein
MDDEFEGDALVEDPSNWTDDEPMICEHGVDLADEETCRWCLGLEMDEAFYG